MNAQTRTARRYHWLSQSLTSFVSEPHAAVCSDKRSTTLNLVALENEEVHNASVELATGPPTRVMKVIQRYDSEWKMRRFSA
jgi:hypothetical protein